MGIDPGLIITGWAVVEGGNRKFQVKEAGVIKVEQEGPLEKRLNQLYDGITEIIETFKPQSAAVEDLYSHYKHPATAILMGHARGVIFLAAGRAGIEVVTYPATRIKKSVTGCGNASKERVQRMVTALLSLSRVPQPPDVADALAVAITHIDACSRPGGIV